MTKKEFKGFWWLPQNEEDRLHGILKFSNEDGAILELFGAFDLELKEYEIILGFTSDGKYITLYNSFDIRRGFSAPGFDTCIIYSNFMIIGDEHFEKKSGLKFHQSIIYLKNLDEWVNKRESFEIDQNWKEKEVNIKYKLPDSKKIDINNHFSLSINPTAKGPARNIVQKEVKITQRINCTFNYKRKRSLDQILEDISNLEDFLTLCSQRQTYPLEFRLAYKKPKAKKSIFFDVYYQVTKPTRLQKDLNPFDFLVYYRNIQNKFEVVIKNWFNTKDSLNTCYIPYFNNFYGKQLYTSDKFLNICRALEAFHRDTVGEIDHRTGRPYHYKQRLVEVFKNSSASYNFLLKITDKENLAKKVKDFRNDFTHSNPILNNRSKRYLEIYHLTEKLTIILTSSILINLGFSKREVKLMIENTTLFNHIKYKR